MVPLAPRVRDMVETRGISTPVKRLDPSDPNKEGEFVSASTTKRGRRQEYEEKNKRTDVDTTTTQGQGTHRRRTNNSARRAVLEREQQQQLPSDFEFFMGFAMLAGITMLVLPCVVVTMALLSGYYWHEQYISFFEALDCVKDAGLLEAASCFGSSLVSIQALSIFLGWIAFQATLERVLPCDVVPGKRTPGGWSLSYRINGHLAFWVSLLIVVHFPGLNLNLSLLYVHFPELAFVACSICILLSIVLYVWSLTRSDAELAVEGSSGNVLYDIWMGRELNPRLGSFDLKFFCELRPGLIGWVVLNIGMASFERVYKGYVSLPMILVVCCQGHYVWDALFNEKSILTTMDITTDGFGYMLAFGDMAWVPFMYSLQARYLATNDPGLSTAYYFKVLGLHIIGYILFRGANRQKDIFRQDPNNPEVAHLKTVPTTRGTRLLVSGYWGLARKINYTGDWLMALSWCLFCGFGSAIPYFYVVYFTVLLVHRAGRDESSCQRKYGADWDLYKTKVPSLFLPGIL